MNADVYNKLSVYQQEVKRLKRSLAIFNRRLVALPAKYGFRSMADFIHALRQATITLRKGPRNVVKATKRRKRAIITADTKDKAKEFFAAKKTGKEISEKLGISLPSVQNIKKELGLVKKRV